MSYREDGVIPIDRALRVDESTSEPPTETPPSPQSEVQDEPDARKAGDFLTEDPTQWTPPNPAAVNRELAREPVQWVIKDHINVGGFGWLLGRRGSYKTGLAVHIAVCTILGRPLFADDRFRVETPGPVLYLDGHENNQLLYGRIARALTGIEATASERDRVWTNLFVKHTTAINFHRGKWVSELGEWAAENGPRLIIYDTFMRFYSGGGYTDDDTSRAIVRDAQIRAQSKAASLWLHHPPKAAGPDPFRGGSGFLDAADFAYEVVEKGNSLAVSCEKFRPGPEPEQFVLDFHEETPEDLLEEAGVLSFTYRKPGLYRIPAKARDQIVKVVRENPGATKRQVIDGVTGRTKDLSQEIDKLVESGDLLMEKDGQAYRYSLPRGEGEE